MDAFVEEITSFEKIHSWWSDETFMKADNKTIRTFLCDTIRQNAWVEGLATKGTSADMDQLKEKLLAQCPKMAQATLMNLLDYLYTFDTAGKPFSEELVSWYRTQGWQFPPFSHEVAAITE